MKFLMAHFGSLRSTLALLVLLLAVIASRPAFAPLALVFGALGLNLAAALVVHPAFRRQLPLLVAHLALLALVVLVGLGRLLALDGRFELTQGVPFDGTLIDAERGPLHRERLRALAFRHEGFEIDYAAGRRRGATRNPVVWTDEDGTERRAVIGDHIALVLDGHRITTTPNKGFAPVLRWQSDRGTPQIGAVHLPSYPANELRQSREWALPDGREAWVQLDFDETLIDPAAPARFRLPERPRLVLRVGGERFVLQPGGEAALPGGTLRFEGLATWMGYRIAYDPTLPWLFVAALLSALAFGVHYTIAFGGLGRRAPRSAGVPG